MSDSFLRIFFLVLIAVGVFMLIAVGVFMLGMLLLSDFYYGV